MNMINLHPVPWEPQTFWERFAPTKNLPILGPELIFLVPVEGSTETLGVAKVRLAGPDLDVAEVGAQTDPGARREEYLEQNRALSIDCFEDRLVTRPRMSDPRPGLIISSHLADLS